MAGCQTHTRACLLRIPSMPRFAGPPRSLMSSRRPEKCARRSLASPQYHSSMVSCMTPAMASSRVACGELSCSLSMRIASPFILMASVLSKWPVSARKQAAVYIEIWALRGDWMQKGT